MIPMYDVAILGGGVVGCAIARELSRYRLDVVLVEKEAEVGFGTTKTNSGIIHAGHHTSLDTLKGRLVVPGNRAFDRLSEELGFGFRRIGELVVARSKEELPILEQLREQGERKGVPVELWDRARLRREEPNLSHRLVGALHAPTAGVVNPYEFAFSLIENAVANGVELWVDSPVVALEDLGEALAVTCPDRSLRARFVVNATGVFADRVAALLGLSEFRILPRKGEEYMLDSRLRGLVQRLIFPVPSGKSKGTLIIPTYDGTIMVGPTAIETEDREDVSTSTEGSEQVFSFVKGLCPAIHERATIAEFAGLRAATASGGFIIWHCAVRGFFHAADIQSHAITASPAIATYLVQKMGEAGLPLIEKAGWNPRVQAPPRFGQQPPERQEELAASDPRFGKVVCRCELVTEAEIHLAIDHGARTLDGVKFRTRAGMGRCQGGFCTTRTLEILSERLGLPFEALTKRGGGSWLVLPMNDAGGDAGDDEAKAEAPAAEGRA
jgi:glycerol-3-phosphate dehydrogenase